MTLDVPDHVRAAMARLREVRKLAANDGGPWIDAVYGTNYEIAQQRHKDDLRTVAYWAIDQRQEFDT